MDAWEELVSLGYSSKDAECLPTHQYFHHKRKTAEELLAVFDRIAKAYGCDFETVRYAVRNFPQFAGLNHKRALRDASSVYGDPEGVKGAVVRFPPFAWLDHQRVVAKAAKVYQDREKVKEAMIRFPSFAGYDHERVVREKTRLGRIVGFGRDEVIQRILKTPFLASYSAKRYIAGLDVGRKLEQEGFKPDKQMIDAYFDFIGNSPYVPGTKRRRISLRPGCTDPPLLKAMR